MEFKSRATDPRQSIANSPSEQTQVEIGVRRSNITFSGEGSLNLTEVSVGGGGEPEEEGADEKHHGDAVHGASQRPRPRRLPPPRRRQRVVRRQRRLAPADDDAAAVRHARPARRSPHPRARRDGRWPRRGETRPGGDLQGCLDGWGAEAGDSGWSEAARKRNVRRWVGCTPPTVRWAKGGWGAGVVLVGKGNARALTTRRGAFGAASAFWQARSFALSRLGSGGSPLEALLYLPALARSIHSFTPRRAHGPCFSFKIFYTFMNYIDVVYFFLFKLFSNTTFWNKNMRYNRQECKDALMLVASCVFYCGESFQNKMQFWKL